MPIKIETFGGCLGWLARKMAPSFSSWAYTYAIFSLRRKETLGYIDDFLSNKLNARRLPSQVSIETINRCNGTCGFCPCNIHDESRPYKRMTEELFRSIVQELMSWDYNGRVVMNINNEPFMDTRIIEWTKHVRESLPKVYIYIITNGTLLSLDKFKQIAPFLDEMNINNYSDKMRLHANLNEIAIYVKNNPGSFRSLKIDLQYRYTNEILSNRNGTSPNKPVKQKSIDEPCLEPYTCMNIYPDGVIGLCCFDALEKTNLGNCQEKTLAEIWNSYEFNQIRKIMRKERSKYGFCKYCDGFAKIIRTKLSFKDHQD